MSTEAKRSELVFTLQRAAALALALGETEVSRHLNRLADMQFSKLPPRPVDARFEHADERQG